jgi:hypothetical protein
MTTKKQSARQEPLLNTIARKLGRAAGTLTHVAHQVTDNLSAGATVRTATGRHPAGKKSRRAAPKRAVKRATTPQRRPKTKKAPRRNQAGNRSQKS